MNAAMYIPSVFRPWSAPESVGGGGLTTLVLTNISS